MLNSNLLNAAAKIMDNNAPAQFTLTAQFTSSDSSSSFSFYPLRIERLVIDRDYLSNYGDVIDLSFIASPKDYALMQDQGQNLLCILTFTYTDKYGKIVFTPAPIQTQYNVMINDPKDIRKSIPDIQNYTEPQTKLTVRLTEPTIYKLRHTKINTVFQNQTPTTVIHSLTQQYGISKIQMVPLDNTHQYDHIDISSYQGIDSVFGYLQSSCGLYMAGAASYITGGVLYIYPPFETAPTYDKTITFYQVDTGRYAGAHVFHKVEDKSTSVVINTQPESYDLSIAGAENLGTGFIFNRASRMTDGYTTIDSQQGAQFTDNPALSVTLKNARTLVKDANNLFHIKTTDNPFPAMSQIIYHQASLMQVRWEHADPFLLDPGHAVNYYYDMNQVMTKKTGIVEHARYEISIITHMNTKDLFGCVGMLTLRLSPNATAVL